MAATDYFFFFLSLEIVRSPAPPDTQMGFGGNKFDDRSRFAWESNEGA